MNDVGIVYLVLLMTVAVFAGPVLAIIALVWLSRIAKQKASAGSGDLAGRLASLARSVDWLRARLDALETSRTPVAPPGPVPPPRTTPPPAEPPVAARVEARPPSAPATRGVDLESIIAGRWLNRVGIVALLLAVAFFLKYAFDNDWIGPAGRVAIGLLFGAALLVFSQILIRRGYV